MENTNAELQMNWFVKVKKYISVEPILLAVGIPLYLQSISIQNFALEKSCRVNLGFSATICDNMIDKALNRINCGNIAILNQTANELENVAFYNVSSFGAYSPLSLGQEVCRAEKESQKLISTINGYMAPLESVIGVLIVLIGGYWSDISGRRRALILYPIIGQLLAQIVLLISAIFMTKLPLEFTAILGSLIGAMSGGVSLLFVGIFCYMTEITPEKDRVFRFGLLYQLYPFMAICTLPFSGILYKKLGYIKIILVSLIFETIGILYVALVLKEPQSVIAESLRINEKISPNQPNSNVELKESKHTENNNNTEKGEKKSDNKSIKDKISDAIADIVLVLMRQRNGKGRVIVWLLLICNFIYIGCEYEFVNEYFFVRTKLNWEALEESPFAAFSSGTAFFGNILMITVFSKYFKMPATIIGLIASTCSTIAKLICITVSATLMLYVGRSFDMFAGSNNIANRSILSIIVDKNEIGRLFSLMGLLDNLSKLIFLPIYTNVYKQTVDTFPNAYFIISFGGMAIIAAIFGLLCFYVNDTAHKPKDSTSDSTESALEMKSHEVVTPDTH